MDRGVDQRLQAQIERPRGGTAEAARREHGMRLGHGRASAAGAAAAAGQQDRAVQRIVARRGEVRREALRQIGPIGPADAAQQADAHHAQLHDVIQRQGDAGLAALDDEARDRIVLLGMLEQQRRQRAVVARLRALDEVLQLFDRAVEARPHRIGEGAGFDQPVAGVERAAQRLAAEVGAAALVRQHEAPAAEGLQLAADRDDVDRAGADRGDGAVLAGMGADAGDDAVMLEAQLLERPGVRQHPLRRAGHVGAGEAEAGGALRQARGRQAALERRPPRTPGRCWRSPPRGRSRCWTARRWPRRSGGHRRRARAPGSWYRRRRSRGNTQPSQPHPFARSMAG